MINYNVEDRKLTKTSLELLFFFTYFTLFRTTAQRSNGFRILLLIISTTSSQGAFKNKKLSTPKLKKLKY